jgi:hypothetical protein
MSFINPYFLFGLFFIAIPIVLHLFDLQRNKKIIFTNVAFLREIIQRQSSARRFKHWLILLTRILFLLFIVLAFAQPLYHNRQDIPAIAGSGVQVYIDNSYSLQNEFDQQNLLEYETGLAQNIPDSYSPSNTYRILTNEFSGDDWHYRTKESYSDQLTELDFNGQSRSYSEVYQRIKSGSEQKKVQDIYLLSDFQKTYWNEMISNIPDSQYIFHIIPVQADEELNICIDSVWLQSPFIQAGKTNKLIIRVKAYGTGKRETICKLFINDIQISTTGINISGNQEITASFEFTLDKSATYKGVIRFDDSPVTFDNAFYFTISSSKEIIITSLHQNTDKYIQKVFGSEGLFKFNAFAYNNIDYSNLNQSDLIILEEYNQSSDALLQNLKKCLNKGGDIVLIPPSVSSDWTQWQQLLSNLNISIKPTTLKDSSGKQAWYIQFPDTDQPFYKDVFTDKKKSYSQMPFSIPLFETTSPGTVLLRYQEGSPFLTEIPSGKGNIYVFSGCLSDALSSFQRHSIFVPIMYNIAFSSINNASSLYYRTTDQALSIDSKTPLTTQIHLFKDTLNWLPVQNNLDSKIIIELPEEIKSAGFYDIKQNDSTITSIAINYGRGESDIRTISEKELSEWALGKKNILILDAVNQNDFSNELKSIREGKPLWKYCIILALFFLLGEIILLRFMK